MRISEFWSQERRKHENGEPTEWTPIIQRQVSWSPVSGVLVSLHREGIGGSYVREQYEWSARIWFQNGPIVDVGGFTTESKAREFFEANVDVLKRMAAAYAKVPSELFSSLKKFEKQNPCIQEYTVNVWVHSFE